MKEEQIHYNYYFWGPLLFKATVNDVDLKKLKKICKKRKDWDYRHNLAGVIDNEYEIDRKEFINIVNRYINAYAQAFKLYYGKEMPGVLNIDSAWVNYMKKGESNPMHIHLPCDLSSVLYLDVPDELLEEQRQFTGKGGGPGSISFLINVQHRVLLVNKYLNLRLEIFLYFLLCFVIALQRLNQT